MNSRSQGGENKLPENMVASVLIQILNDVSDISKLEVESAT